MMNIAKKRLVTAIVIAFVLLRPSTSCGLTWQKLKGKHFIIYYQEQDKAFASKTLTQSEKYYKAIPARLGFPRHSDFWTWDNRVKLYIYPDKVSFLAATGKQGWVRAVSSYQTKEITSYKGYSGAPFLDSTLPHELAHLVVRDFLGIKTKVPLWLEEGIAQAMEKGKARQSQAYVKKLLNTDGFIHVGTLTRLDVRRVRDRQLVDIFYMEACCLVNFMIEKHGKKKFTRFCRELRDGKKLNDALRTAYPNSISDVDKLNAKWRKYLE